ncbi:MAG: hypothetical protein K2G01_02355, partial [Paramuribaculum sp.]|nr:hypothetical protein [Paramuribaculum sp.]
FEVSISDNVATVSSKTSEFFTTTNPTGPVLPMTMKKVLNPSGSHAVDVDVAISKKLIASDVAMESCGEFTPTNAAVAAAAKKNAFATASEMDAVGLMAGKSAQNGYSFSYYSLKPFLYDADARELYFVNKISFTPRFESLLKSRASADVAEIPRPDMVDFSDVLNISAKETYPSPGSSVSRGAQQQNETIDYLIITERTLIWGFPEFVKWKRQKGLNVKLVTIDEIDALYPDIEYKPLRIKTYIKKLYQENKLSYVLLGGTPDIVPRVPCYSPIEGRDESDGKLDSDTYYSCLSDGYSFDWNGNGYEPYGEYDDNIDLDPDICLGRLLATGPGEVGIACKKIIEYEKGRFPDENINKILLGGSSLKRDQDPYPAVEGKSFRHINGELLDNLHMKPYGKQASYIFDTTVSPKFTSKELASEINKNYHFINIDCHGATDAWICCENENNNDNFDNDNIKSLTNIPAVFTTTACYTNDFRSESKGVSPQGARLSHILTTSDSIGSVAYISSSGLGWRIGYGIAASSLYNATFYMNLFGTNSRPHGNIISRIHNQVITNLVKINQDIYRYLFLGINVSGDPAMTLFTEIPKTIVPPSMTWTEEGLRIRNIPSGLMVSINAVDEETTCLGKCISTGDDVFPGINRPCVLTISGVNYRPYQYHIRNYPVLTLEDMTVTEDSEYTADRIYLGDNVNLRSMVTLKLNYREFLKVRDNINCDADSKLIINHKK